MNNEIVRQENVRKDPRAAMPWLLIVVVSCTTVAAVAVPSDGERLVVLAIAEALIVGYFCVALRKPASRAVREQERLDVDREQRPSAF